MFIKLYLKERKIDITRSEVLVTEDCMVQGLEENKETLSSFVKNTERNLP